MRYTVASHLFLILLGLVFFTLTITAEDDSKKSHDNKLQQTASLKINQQLKRALIVRDKLDNTRISIDRKETKLRIVIEEIVATTNENIAFNENDLENENIDLNEVVSFQMKDVSIHDALSTICQQHEMAYRVDDESSIIRIHSREFAEEDYFVRIYNCQELLFPPEKIQEKCQSIEFAEYSGRSQHLINLISRLGLGSWLSFDGDGGDVIEFDGQLIIKQNEKTHRQVKRLLDKLLLTKQNGAKVWVKYPPPSPDDGFFGK